MKTLHIALLHGMPILEQLFLEEALLRSDDRNICLINYGSSRAVVLGLSGEPRDLVDLEHLRNHPLPTIRRFSGGGAVVIDENTLFVSFLFSKNTLPHVFFPESILRWTYTFYKNCWNIPGFSLRENDYAVEDRKCGGNAQYLQKDRWLHHTSFLWDFKEENMKYLLLPAKRPAYREGRSHVDFLCRMKQWATSPSYLVDCIQQKCREEFQVHELTMEELAEIRQRPHRRSTHVINYTEAISSSRNR